jgi:Raf kinase inhibitor-like YbhB/YbcL family protein
MAYGMKIIGIVCLIYLAVGTVGCGEDNDETSELSEPQPSTNWKIQSSAFADGEGIPKRFTCEGEDISPPLSWTEAPSGTKSVALLMDDLDAQFTHWILYNLPSDRLDLNENILKQLTLSAVSNAKQAENDFGKVGYGGPCPPPGAPHRYRFRLFALDIELTLPPDASRADFVDAVENHVIEEALLTGSFRR